MINKANHSVVMEFLKLAFVAIVVLQIAGVALSRTSNQAIVSSVSAIQVKPFGGAAGAGAGEQEVEGDELVGIGNGSDGEQEAVLGDSETNLCSKYDFDGKHKCQQHYMVDNGKCQYCKYYNPGGPCVEDKNHIKTDGPCA